MSCACRVLKCLWSMIVGALRMLLFFAALFLILLTIINTITLTGLFSYYNGRLANHDYAVYKIHAWSFITLVTALFGVYGSFSHNRWGLKVFSTMATIQSLVIVGFLLWTNSTNYFHHQNERILANISNEMPQYDWNKLTPESPSKKATLDWDRLQSDGCCGINGPHDWDQYRPLSVAPDVYPRSCCSDYQPSEPLDPPAPPKQVCSSKSELLIHLGCRTQLERNVNGLVVYFIVYSVFLLVLAGLACCIRAQASLDREYERNVVAQVTIVPSNNNNHNNYYSEKSAPIYPNPHLIYGTLD